GGRGVVTTRPTATTTVAPVATRATVAAVTTTMVATRATVAGGGLLAGQLLGGQVALVDPDRHADAAEGGAGLVEAVVDVRPEGVQRHAALTVELRARHLGAAETTGALDPDALGAGPERGLHTLAHRATEGHAGGELLGDALGDQLGVHLGVLDLE